MVNPGRQLDYRAKSVLCFEFCRFYRQRFDGIRQFPQMVDQAIGVQIQHRRVGVAERDADYRDTGAAGHADIRPVDVERDRYAGHRVPGRRLVALLDPQMTVGMPPKVTAMTGMDALVHAIESYVGVRASVFTDTLNLQAIRLVAANLRLAYANGENRAARENMLHASCIAGMAFSNTQNGLDHALALAIGGRHHLPHGTLTAFILPWVMEFNLIAAPGKFIEIDPHRMFAKYLKKKHSDAT